MGFAVDELGRVAYHQSTATRRFEGSAMNKPVTSAARLDSPLKLQPAGTPVIVTEECGIAPLLEGAAGLVVAHDAAAISGAIERVFSEPGLHARLTAGCREFVARLGWEEPVREMEGIYGRLVEGARRVA